MIELRDYQRECVDTINNLESGSHLVAVATGLGKTVIFSHLERKGRMLILSHRDELVHQPEKYFDCTFGVEQAGEKSNGEEVVSASVQSLTRRLGRFSPDDFDMIITDEAHHAAAPSYKKIYDYFKPRLHIGFTATPNRGDKVRLDDVFGDIIFERNLRWGIEHKYLTNIKCLQADIGFDLRKVKKKMGDFDSEQLAEAVNQEKMNAGVAKAYYELAQGQTIIFAANVAHAYAIAEKIEGAVVVTGKTENRSEIIERFTNREIKCIVNVMVFTEGTDLPLVETIIIARPTMNESLYTQMVGRGLRLYKGKDCLTLIDCVGVSGNKDLCTAPSLFGIDLSDVPEKKRTELDGVMITEMENKLPALLNNPEAWIINTDEVELFASQNGFNTHFVNWTRLYDGSFICNFKEKNVSYQLRLTPMTCIGTTNIFISRNKYEIKELGRDIKMQTAFDYTAKILEHYFKKSAPLWDVRRMKVWGSSPASDKQKDLIHTLLNQPKNINRYHSADFDVSVLTKYQAGIILDKLFSS